MKRKGLKKPLSKSEVITLLGTPDGFLIKVFPKEKYGYTRDELRLLKREASPDLTTEEKIQLDLTLQKSKKEKKETDSKYQSLLNRISELEKEKEILFQTRGEFKPFPIKRSSKNGKWEATIVVLASDWHFEEVVKKQWVDGLNQFDKVIAHKRAERFFENTATLIKQHQKNIYVENIVFGLLGDFITGNIHEENLEVCRLSPAFAIKEVQSVIKSGIEFLLDETKMRMIVPCVSGNHSRITRKIRHATLAGNSLETGMYLNLAERFENDDRVKFFIEDSYFQFQKVYDWNVRFHHGHYIRYNGGVGGIYIPARKAISQWNKSIRANLDCFGHFHQMKDDGMFTTNSSLIGYNPYAVSLKADFEKPFQKLFLIQNQKGFTMKTQVTPIFLE